MTKYLESLQPNAPLQYSVFLPDVSPQVIQLIKEIYHSPALQALANITENNPWHDQENGLEHVEVVFANIQELLRFSFLSDPETQRRYREYMQEVPVAAGSLTRAELLLLAVSVHDISKGQLRPSDDIHAGKTYVFMKADGKTSGSGHEAASAEMVPGLLNDAFLTKEEVLWIQALVRNHDQYSLDYVSTQLHGYQTGDVVADKRTVLEAQPERAVELLLHIIADENGAPVSQWKTDYLLHYILGSGFLMDVRF